MVLSIIDIKKSAQIVKTRIPAQYGALSKKKHDCYLLDEVHLRDGENVVRFYRRKEKKSRIWFYIVYRKEGGKMIPVEWHTLPSYSCVSFLMWDLRRGV